MEGSSRSSVTEIEVGALDFCDVWGASRAVITFTDPGAVGSWNKLSCFLTRAFSSPGDREGNSKAGSVTAEVESAVFPELEGVSDDSASVALFLLPRYRLAPLERRRRPPRRPRVEGLGSGEGVLS